MGLLLRLQKMMPTPDRDKGIHFILLSQFGLAFSFNVVMSFMPFYIIRVSTYNPHDTTIWIGLIMGLNSFVGAGTATLWGSLTAKFNPKWLFESAFLANGIIFLLMGFTESLPILLILRLFQGGLGGASTAGLFMITQLSAKERLAGNLSLYQNSMTAGGLLGPPVGAYLVAHLGYLTPFIVSAAMIGVFLLLCHVYVAEIGKKETDRSGKSSFSREVKWGWVLSFIATAHLIFLPSILPHVLQGFNLAEKDALKAAGFIMMGYTATAIIGSYAISRLTPKAKLTGVIVAACLAASFFQVLLYFSQGVVSFTVIRMLQTGAVAAVLPLVMASFGSRLGGTEIGFLNSARFAGMGVGPLLATFVLAGSNLLTLYLIIAAATVAPVLAYLFTIRKAPRAVSV
ncbi:MAG: MFS transporter [Deltaproteobacteria bacterium]|nr:MFS transporter [Deltaproteobacteria bacterium]